MPTSPRLAPTAAALVQVTSKAVGIRTVERDTGFEMSKAW